MTIPSRSEAARLLRSLEPPEWYVRHVCAVADVASWLALRTAANGGAVDRLLVEVAALLHDIDKLPAAGAPAALRHGEGSAAWLEAHGWPELAVVVRDHPVTRLADPGYQVWVRTATLEARLVAYADKRAGQRLEPMAERFGKWTRRNPVGGWDSAEAALLEARARKLEAEVCAAAAVRPTDVRRLRWSRRAFRDAAA